MLEMFHEIGLCGHHPFALFALIAVVASVFALLRVRSILPMREVARTIRDRAAFILTLVLLLAVLVGFTVEPAMGQADADIKRFLEANQDNFVVVETDIGQGSGFFVASDMVVTNYHVISRGDFITVMQADKGRFKAELIKYSIADDLALLQVGAAFSRENPLEIAASSPSVLDTVIAVGNPLGMNRMITVGRVSRVDDDRLLGDYLIAPGSSGGALLKDRQVVGVNAFGIADFGGAIPVDKLNRFLDDVNRIELAGDFNKLLKTNRDSEKAENRFPTDTLDKRYSELAGRFRARGESSSEDKLNRYIHQAGDFTFSITTPVISYYHYVVAAAESRSKRQSRRRWTSSNYPQVGEELLHSWMRRSLPDHFHTTVSIEFTPRIKQTGGSIAGQIAMGAIFGVGAANAVQSQYKYTGEYLSMNLCKEQSKGAAIAFEPVRRRRVHLGSPDLFTHDDFSDETFAGIHWYDAGDFFDENAKYFVIVRTPKSMRTKENLSHPCQQPYHHRVNLHKKVVEQIRRDFDWLADHPSNRR